MKHVRAFGLTLLERTLAVLDRIARRRGTSQKLAPHLRLGFRGEEAAYFYLCHNGYTVVARRWSAGDLPGDVDLIAWQGETLCFFEVKTRSTRDNTPAESAVHEHKRSTLRRLARRYVRQLNREPSPRVRFDVISVYLLPDCKPEVVHHENAFGWR